MLRQQIGWSIGPLLTTNITGIPGLIFSLACATSGGLMALPLLIVLLFDLPRYAMVVQIATYIGVPVVVIGFIFAILVQLALDLGSFIARLRDRPER